MTLVEVGGAVEAPNGLWHIVRHGVPRAMLRRGYETFCGQSCDDWPRVTHPTERSGIWCGPCLMEAARKVIADDKSD